MVTPLHILIVEDQVNDVELLVHTLHDYGFSFQWKFVATEEEYLSKLEPSLDLILSDYHLPQLDAMRALHLLKERRLDIPFIVVSGTATEDMAIAVMRAGARDYILKDNLTRLAPAVERELHEAKIRRERRALQQALAANEKVLEGFFSSATAGMVILDAELRYMQINQALAEMNGSPVVEHLGKTVREVVPQLAPTVEPLLRSVLESGKPILDVEVSDETANRPGFVQHWVESIFPILGSTGSPVAVGAVIVDITRRKKAQEALRISEARFKSLFDSKIIGIIIADTGGNITEANDAFLHMVGYTHADLPLRWDRITPPEWHPLDQRAIEEIKQQGVAAPWEKEYLRKDGRRVPILVGAVLLPDSKGNCVCFVVDITERKRYEEALVLFRALIDRVTDSIEVIDPSTGRFLDVNEEACREHGYSREEFLKLSVRDLEVKLDVSSPDAWRTAVEDIRAQGSLIMEGEHRRKDGSVFPVEIKVTYIHNDGDYLVAVVRDITERKRVEVEREQSRDRLQMVSTWLMEAQEDERRHIARELHDEVGQGLTALKLGLQMIEKQPDAVWKEYLRTATQQVDELLARVRSISLDLRPAMLDDLGLLPALLWHFERFSTMTNVRVDFRHAGLDNLRFPSEIETTVYRVVQEALTNVARHADVKEATVRVWADETTLGVEVEDRGKGFDSTAVPNLAVSSGLSGMRERVTLFGGEFAIESAPGRGTQLGISLPVHRGEPA